MAFLEMQQDVFRRTGHVSSPATDVSTRIKSFLNRWNRKVLSKPGMESLRRGTITKASVASQATYGVSAKLIRYVYEATTQRKLIKKTPEWYRANFPDPSRFTGTPEFWIPLGQTRVHTQPSAAATLYAVSSEAADVGIARVQAIRSDGYPVSLAVTLTGTTPVALVNASGSGSITDVIQVLDVRLSAAQTGFVTVTQGSGGTELSRVLIGQTAARFLRYALAPTPSQVITYNLDIEADIIDLSNDTDDIWMNTDFDDILVDGAVHDEWRSRGRNDEARELRLEIDSRIRDLANSIFEWPDAPDPGALRRTFDQTIEEPIS